MKYSFFLAVVILFFSEAVLCQSEEGPVQTDEKPGVQSVQQPKRDGTGPQKPDEKEWPPPFKPSEEVGADSVISFPTDI